MKRTSIVYLLIFLTLILAGITTLADAVTISDVRASNHSSSSVKITWVTDTATGGEVQYGEDKGALTSVAETRTNDDIHIVPLTGLASEKTYFYKVISGGQEDDNNGDFYQFTTAKEVDPPPSYTIEGVVKKHDGNNAQGALVFATVTTKNDEVSHPISTEVDENGNWVLNLGNLKNRDDGDKITVTGPFTLQGLTFYDKVSIDVQGGNDGTVSPFEVNVESNAANTSAAIGTKTLVPPAQLIDSVTVVGSPAKVGGTITVTATGVAGATVNFSIDGVTGATNVTMTEDPSGTYTGSYTVQAGDNATDATVTVTLTKDPDAATDTSKTVTIDTTNPTIAITSPADGDFSKDTSLTVEGTVSDTNLDTVVVNGVPATVTNGDFSAADVALDTEGSNTIGAVATDTAGNSNSASISVTRDTTAPTIAITSPVDGFATKDTSITVEGTVSDANLDTVVVNSVTATVTNGNFSAANVPLNADSANNIQATATDKADNSSSDSISVTQDSTPPDINSPDAQPSTVGNGDTLDLSVNAEPGATVMVDVSPVDNTQTTPIELTETATGTFTGSVVISSNNTAANGAKTITFTATDGVDNSSTTDATVTLDNLFIDVTSDKAGLAPDGTSQATITTEVTDASGAGLTGKTVTGQIITNPPGGNLTVFAEIGDGIYEATYTAPTLQVAETPATVTIQGTVDGISDTVDMALRFISMTVEVVDDTLTANATDTTTVTIELKDELDQPITDENVTLQVTGSGTVTSSAAHQGDGIYTATYTAGTVAGDVTITATAEGRGVSETVEVTLGPGPATNVAVDAPATLEVSATGMHVITITVTDINGNLVADEEVTVTVTGSGTVDAAVTNIGDGTYTTTYYTGTTAGTDTLTANATKAGVSGTAQIALTAGPLDMLTVSPDTALVPIGRTRQFSVTGEDEFGNPVTPTGVAWEVTGGIGTIDATGLFEATTEGEGTVKATSEGIPGESGTITVVDRIPGDAWGPADEPDGQVDIHDLVQIGLHWHETSTTTTAPTDLFESLDIAGSASFDAPDGVIDIYDLIVMADNFGVGVSAAPSLVASLPVSTTARISISPEANAFASQSDKAIRTTVGSKFDVSIRLDGIEGLRGYSFDMGFDSDVLTVLKDGGSKPFIEGDILKVNTQSDATFAISQLMTTHKSDDTLNANAVILGKGSSAKASGTLGQVRFNAASTGEFEIALRQIMLFTDAGVFTIPGVTYKVLVHKRVTESKLLQNFPNPFNPETWIPYELHTDADVTIKIYDILGKLVKTIDIGRQVAGPYTTKAYAAYWDGRSQLGEKVACGVYFYQLHAGKYSSMRKMVILK